MPTYDTIELCRDFRKNPTEAEKVLWQHLKNGLLSGYKFRRQHPMEGYILDFYCAEALLAVELDGEPHKDSEQREYDEIRSQNLADLDIQVVRFWNHEVFTDIDQLKRYILKKIRERMEYLPKVK